MKARKVIKVYSSIITKNIPLFLAVGLLNILFSASGWFPNPAMEEVAGYLYEAAIPILLGYYAGKYPGRQVGGLAGAIGAAGLVCAGSQSVMTGAILIGFASGYMTDTFYKKIETRLPTGFEMMTRNLTISILGVLWAGIAYYLLSPLLRIFDNGLLYVLNGLIKNGLLPGISLFIEPLKIFFLNNCINHGLLIPIGMEQLQTAGTSVLFLLETNPGPGLGVLLAVFFKNRETRTDTASVIGVHVLGGIHEVYLPYVLANLRLILSVTAGGLVGSMWFVWSGVGLKGAVSPGSILTILLMSEANDMIPIITGILLSTLVSFLCSCFLMGMGQRADVEAVPEQEEAPGSIRRIYVVCDAGLGSSAMGAALLRRLLRTQEITGIDVLAAASDDIPADADLLVCQRDFYLQGTLSEVTIPFRQVERLTNMEAYGELVSELKGRE